MLPVLLDLKFIKIYTFGVFLVLAFFWGCFLLWKLIRLTVYKEEDVFDGLFLSLAGGLFLGRLVYVILNFKDFGFDFFKFILINGYPGISLYGSLLGSFLVLLIYFSAKKIRFLDIIDYFISPLFLSLALGKLGAFFSGVEIGIKTRFFLSAHYAGFDGYRHLPALYEGILFLLGAYIAYRLIFEVRKEKLTHGFVIVFFVWFFALTNFIFFRWTEGYSTLYQMISKILLLTFSVYFLYYFRSLLLSFFNAIINLVKKYGQKAYQKVYRLPKEKLEKDNKKILNQIVDLKKNDPFADPSHASDNAAVDTDVREQVGHDTIEAQIKDLTRKANDIQLALNRISKGKYGLCEKCHKPIPMARLKLITEAQYCVVCENKLRI